MKRLRPSPAVLAGLLLTASLAYLHLVFYHHAGALWRDEVNLVNVATLPSLGSVFAHFHLDSFPFAWLTLFHTWTVLVGTQDAALRLFGLLAGLTLLPAIWWTSRRLGVDAPLLTLLLLCMSPSTIIYGDSVRGYGLGTVAISWTIGAMWAFLRRPAWKTFAVVQLASLLAVQTYVPNGVLLVAAGVGSTIVCVRRRAWRTLAALTAAGAMTCASLTPIVPWVRYAFQVGQIEQGNWSLGWLLGVFAGALAPATPALTALWVFAPIFALVGYALAARPSHPTHSEGDADRAIFAISTGLSAPILFLAYLKFIARLPTHFWYYLSLMAVLALSIDVGVWLLARRFRYGPMVRVAVVALVAALAMGDVAATVRVRMTNVDVIAKKLEAEAGSGDLVVVFPWVTGISFQRYYDGAAPWITLPDFDEHRFHLHLLVAEKMKLGDRGVSAELSRVEQTLRRGGRVWVAGPLRAPPPEHAPPSLPPAPRGPQGWRAAPYLDAWEMQLGALLRAHALEVWNVELPGTGPVSVWEVLPLIMAEGWRE